MVNDIRLENISDPSFPTIEDGFISRVIASSSSYSDDLKSTPLPLAYVIYFIMSLILLIYSPWNKSCMTPL